MDFSEIDRWCDLFEERLNAGELLSADEFRQTNGLPHDEQLMAELLRVENEYQQRRGGSSDRDPDATPVVPPAPQALQPTQPMPADADETVKRSIGPYKLLQKLGEGGMGVVYLAEQSRPVARRVALKIIKPGMDSRQVLARFEAERQALALMDHPHIARVLDAGTTDEGRPFFVMELVKGIPITKYCDEKRLTPRERLELFIPICQAVQHAHHKGVIHRDLKPTNVLVAELDGRPVPKIIDFGLAKAISQRLTEQTMFTQLGQVVGTVDYMSPEQATSNQLDVDTRSDVYSLGVLLYELLTGETPFDRKRLHQAALDEMLRIIRHEEPPRPSARLSSHESLPAIAANRRTEPKKLGLIVRGELDWIVMKALEKDRSRRYETPNSLAEDVARYLANEPVQAGPPSAVYRFRKFVHRNKRGLSAATLILIGLLIAAASVGWAIQDRAHRQALAFQEEQNRRAENAAQVRLILDEIYRLEAQEEWAEALSEVRFAELTVSGLVRNEDIDSELIEEVRRASSELAFVDELDRLRFAQQFTAAGEFDYEGTDRAYAAAFERFGLKIEELSTDDAVAQLRSHSRVAVPLAAGLDEWSFAVWELADDNDPLWQKLVTIASEIDSHDERNRLREAWRKPITDDLKNELTDLAAHMDVSRQTPATCLLVSDTLYWAGLIHLDLSFLQRTAAYHGDDFWVNSVLGDALIEQQRFDEAARYLTAAVAIRPDRADAQYALGRALILNHESPRAEPYLRRAIALDGEHAPAHNELGAVLALRSNDPLAEPAECQAFAVEAEDEFRTAIELDPLLTDAHLNLGILLRDLSRWDEAEESFQSALENEPTMALAWLELGRLHQSHNREVEAEDCFRAAVESSDELVDAGYSESRYALGALLHEQGRLEEAEQHYRAISWGSSGSQLLRQVLLERGEFAEVLGMLDARLSLDHDQFRLLHDMVWILVDCPDESLRDPELGVDLATAGIEFGHEAAGFRRLLGLAHYRVGEWEDARLELTRTLDEEGEDPRVLFVRSMANWQLDRPDEARQDFARAIELMTLPDVETVMLNEVQRFHDEAAELLGVQAE